MSIRLLNGMWLFPRVIVVCLAVALAVLVCSAPVTSQDPDEPAREPQLGREPRFDHARLTEIGVGVHSSVDEVTGGPKLLVASAHSLLAPPSEAPDDSARAFIAANADLWGLDAASLADLVIERDFTIDGVRNIWFSQEADGIPFFESRIKTVFGRDGALLVVSGVPHRAPSKQIPQREAAAAMRDAMRAAQVLPKGLGALTHDSLDGKPGARFEKGALLDAPSTRLVLFPTSSSPRLAWRASIVPDMNQNLDVVIDDATGAVLYKENLVAAAGPEGEVFVMPNPDPDSGATPVVVPFVGPLPAPHDAWVSGTITAGNNAFVGEDRNWDGTPIPANSATQQFNFGFTNDYELNQNSLTDVNAAITNTFYWMNVAHDFLYGLGFTEAAGNYQNDNFGLGGVDNDAITVWVQRGADAACPSLFPSPNCFNNASFSGGLTDGGLTLIQVLLNRPPGQYTDMAFASDIILHEYGHGLHFRNVGGIYGLQAGALGEAWADYLGETITDDPVMGEYANGNQELGIRRSRQDMSTALYGDMCTVVSCEVHRDGETWATALWDMRRTMVSLYGPTVGRGRSDELYYLGLTLTPDSPDFLDARDGILAADAAYFAGADECYLWNVFANRGMGASAESFGSTSRDTLEAFDLPSSCMAPGPDADADGMPDSYEVLYSCLNSASNDAAGNADADGETNIGEYVLATNPCVLNGSGLAPGTTVRQSVTTAGGQTLDGDSYAAAMSDSGRYVAFTSTASNLVSGDGANSLDAFVRDRDTNANGVFDEPGFVSTTLVTRGMGPDYPGYNNFDIDISANGRYVSFASFDFALVTGDTNDSIDSFIFDRDADADGIFDEMGFTAINRVSVSSSDVQGSGHAAQTAMNNSGRFVTFTTSSGNLAAGDENQMYDVYVRDRDADADGIFDEPAFVATTRVSTDGTGTDTDGNSGYSAISDSGRYVVFYSSASNVVAGDTNGVWDIFVRDRDTDADGVFDEPGFVATKRMSESVGGVQGNFLSFDPDISGDGRYVVFSSLASNLVPGDSGLFADVFIRDRDADNDGIFDEPTAVSLLRIPTGGEFGTAGRKHFGKPQISRDGRTIVFNGSGVRSDLASIASGRDVYVFDRTANVVRQVSTHAIGGDEQRNSHQPMVSADGRFVTFYSSSADIVSGDTNTLWDTFVFDRDDGDGIAWSLDNCGADANPAQENADTNFIDHPLPITQDDKTLANSDAAGNVCDSDDDNDGITDAWEASGAGCGSVVTDPLLADTDADRFLDGAECVMGFDPTSAASKPTVAQCAAHLGVTTSTDTDGDKFRDYLEFCSYNSSPASADTDGDKALDGAIDRCEIASVNGDRLVNVADRGLIAQAVSNPARRHVNIDINKDGVFNVGDVGLVGISFGSLTICTT